MACPFYPQQQTSSDRRGMSGLCQTRTLSFWVAVLARTPSRDAPLVDNEPGPDQTRERRLEYGSSIARDILLRCYEIGSPTVRLCCKY
jgi:hypothetical protein